MRGAPQGRQAKRARLRARRAGGVKCTWVVPVLAAAALTEGRKQDEMSTLTRIVSGKTQTQK